MRSDEVRRSFRQLSRAKGSVHTGRVAVNDGEEGGSDQGNLGLVDVLANAAGGRGGQFGSKTASFDQAHFQWPAAAVEERSAGAAKSEPWVKINQA